MAIKSPPTEASSRRVIPRHLTEEQRERLLWLVTDPEQWVLRPDWEQFLLHGDHATLVDTHSLSADHREAALAWLRQQRHALYQALHGDEIAPDGWLESLPLYGRLSEPAPPARPAARRPVTTPESHRI
ncbi:MAG: hypothetical protein WD011_07765 [Nitriliruptoraceae bacterium]